MSGTRFLLLARARGPAAATRRRRGLVLVVAALHLGRVEGARHGGAGAGVVAARLLVVRRRLVLHLGRVEEVRELVVRRCLHGACEAMGGLSVRPRTDVGWGPCNSTPSPTATTAGGASCLAPRRGGAFPGSAARKRNWTVRRPWDGGCAVSEQ